MWGRGEWCNPPFGLIGRALEHAQASKASMCLIAPFWPSAKWWHKLIASPSYFQPFVRDCTVLDQQSDLFFGAACGGTTPVRTPAWRTMALYIDCTQAYQCAACLPLPRL